MTRDQLQAYVLARSTIESDDSAAVTNLLLELDSAYAQIVSDVGLLPDQTTLTLNEDATVVALPADCGRIDRITADGQNYEPATIQEFAALEGSDEGIQSTGKQYIFMWSVDNSDNPAIRVQPAGASGGTTMNLYYFKTPTPMTAGTDSPSAIPARYQLVIAEYAIESLFLMDEEPGLAAAARAKGDVIYARLGRWAVERVGERRMQRTIRGAV